MKSKSGVCGERVTWVPLEQMVRNYMMRLFILGLNNNGWMNMEITVATKSKIYESEESRVMGKRFNTRLKLSSAWSQQCGGSDEVFIKGMKKVRN